MYNANISIRNDRLIRICCLNYQLNKPPTAEAVCDNTQLYEYLDKQITNGRLFSQITVKDLKNQCKTSISSSHNNVTGRIIFKLKKKIQEFHDIFDKLPNGSASTCLNYEYVYCFAKSLWFVGPLFVFSRVFYFIFPIILLIEEFNYFVNEDDNTEESLLDEINDIVLFQVVLFGCYYCLVIVWIVNFLNVCDFYYWSKLVGIGSGKWDIGVASVLFSTSRLQFWIAVIEKYNKIIDDVAIRQILCQYLGNDIASIVFGYYVQISISDIDN